MALSRYLDPQWRFTGRNHRPPRDPVNALLSLCYTLVAGELAMGYAHNSLFGTRRGILQGAVLSPLWCNLYLHQLDRAWERRNLPFVRYADDFLLFASDRKRAVKALDWTDRQLRKLGLRLHPDKTRVTLTRPHVVFLGKNM